MNSPGRDYLLLYLWGSYSLPTEQRFLVCHQTIWGLSPCLCLTLSRTGLGLSSPHVLPFRALSLCTSSLTVQVWNTVIAYHFIPQMEGPSSPRPRTWRGSEARAGECIDIVQSNPKWELFKAPVSVLSAPAGGKGGVLGLETKMEWT